MITYGMGLRTRITTVAKQRGLSAAEVARKLRLYPSNLSAMDAGTRPVSLRLLLRIAEFLHSSPADLIEVNPPQGDGPLWRGLSPLLDERMQSLPDGTERGWVHTTLLAWQRHYAQVKHG